MRLDLFAVSSRLLRYADRIDLLVPQATTAIAQHHAFATIGPSFYEGLPLPIIRSIILAAFHTHSSAV